MKKIALIFCASFILLNLLGLLFESKQPIFREVKISSEVDKFFILRNVPNDIDELGKVVNNFIKNSDFYHESINKSKEEIDEKTKNAEYGYLEKTVWIFRESYVLTELFEADKPYEIFNDKSDLIAVVNFFGGRNVKASIVKRSNNNLDYGRIVCEREFYIS